MASERAMRSSFTTTMAGERVRRGTHLGHRSEMQHEATAR